MHYFISWLITTLMFLFIAFIMFFILSSKRKAMRTICTSLAVFSLAAGLFFHTQSFIAHSTTIAESPIAMLNGLFNTIMMFIFPPGVNENIEFIAETPLLANNTFMQVIFWASQVTARIATQTFVVYLVGKKYLDSIRLSFGLHKEIYIILSGEKNALTLGENIARCDDPQSPPSPNRLVLFLIDDSKDEKEVYEKVIHFGGIVRTIDKSHNLEYFLEKTGLGKPGRHKKKKYKVFLKPDDLYAADNALKVSNYAAKKEKKRKRLDLINRLDIYVITSSEWVKEQVVETIKDNDIKYTFHIIDEIDLLIRKMIDNHLPVDCPGLEIGKDNKGIAKREFTIMILGFKVIGQRALIHLTMNGQFVIGNIKDGEPNPVMRAIILDNDAERLISCFRNDVPALDISCKIEQAKMTVPCAELNDYLERDLDYIVIAFKDDNFNRYTARYISNYYKRKNKEKEDIPFIAVYEKNGIPHNVKADERIFSFGCREEIYTDSIIVREEFDIKAKAVSGIYSNETDKDKLDEKWRASDLFTQESNRASASFIDSMLKLAGNIKAEDAMELDTLVPDDDKDNLKETLAHTEHLRWNAFHVAMGYDKMSLDTMEKRFYAHKEQGLDGNRLDYARKDSEKSQHICIVPWVELNEVSKEYRVLADTAYNDARDDDEFKERYSREKQRDFKKTDEDIVVNIPKSLKAAASHRNSTLSSDSILRFFT